MGTLGHLPQGLFPSLRLTPMLWGCPKASIEAQGMLWAGFPFSLG